MKVSSKCLMLMACVTFWSKSVLAIFADNTTDKYMSLDEDQLMRGRILGSKRQPKFLSFTTLDDEISIEMQLSVPFLTIPVKKTMDTAAGMMSNFPSANINLAAVGLAGAVIFASAFVVPSILRILAAEHIGDGGPSARANDEVPKVFEVLNREMSLYGAPPADCARRAICTLVHRASASSNPSSTEKILDGLASNEWLQRLLDGTVISDGLASGHSGENCSLKYSKCKISQGALQNLAKAFSDKILNNSIK